MESKEPEEPKKDILAEESVVPPEAVEPQQEASVNTPDTEKLVTGGQETEEEKEKQEKKTNDDVHQEEEKKEMKEEKELLETEREEQSEAGAEKSTELEEQPKDAPEEPESVESALEEKKEESEGPEEVPSQQEVPKDKVEDTTDSAVVNKGTEKIESDLEETSAGGSADTNLSAVGAPAAAALAEEEQEETTQERAEEMTEGEAPEETVLPQQDSQPKQDVEVEEPAPDGSGVSEVVSKASEDAEPVAPRKEEEAARADDNSCQDAVSVPESETDSESKTEQGSPAVAKPDVEKDSDSGSSSAADNSSLDLNLSISSFLSKSKEGGSVSMQVSRRYWRPARPVSSNHCPVSFSLNFLHVQEAKRQKKTLKKTRKFLVDGVEVSVTTSKIVTDNDAKNEEMRFLRCVSVHSAPLLILVRQCNVAHLTYMP